MGGRAMALRASPEFSKLAIKCTSTL